MLLYTLMTSVDSSGIESLIAPTIAAGGNGVNDESTAARVAISLQR